jgi:hypothetical protein
MSVYHFERAGEVIEREFRIGRAPDQVRVNGRVYRRRITAPTVLMADDVNGREIYFVANSLDPKHHRFHRGAFHTNEHGERKPVFRSRNDIDSFERNAAREGVKLHYGRFRGADGGKP